MNIPPDTLKILNTPQTMVSTLELFKRKAERVKIENDYLGQMASLAPDGPEKKEALKDIGRFSEYYQETIDIINKMIGIVAVHEITNEVNDAARDNASVGSVPPDSNQAT